MTSEKDLYGAIRPYNDDEVPAALERLVNDSEFIGVFVAYFLRERPAWLKAIISPFLALYLRHKWSGLTSVDEVQREIKKYLDNILVSTTDGVSYSGLNRLDRNTPNLFISNHRDIAMDPALINYGLYTAKQQTARIAIGDNLLKKPCVNELMRINKSFIVNRSSKGPREKMRVLRQLSAYIKHSLETKNSVWIAQREGRTKDGNDITDPAVLKMLYVEGKRRKLSFPDYMKTLKIIPISISYENDPCDLAKVKELYEKEVYGKYEKSELEDIESIVHGILGYKGRISVAFGEVIEDKFEDPDSLAKAIDRQIYHLYKLFPINLLASEIEDDSISNDTKSFLKKKLTDVPKRGRDYLIASYANPAKNKNKN